MADLVQAVKLTAQMQHMRDTMRSVWGEEYPEKVVKWQTAIKHVADVKHVAPLQAAIQIAKEASGNGFAVIAIMAAFVEMVEPSDNALPPRAAP